MRFKCLSSNTISVICWSLYFVTSFSGGHNLCFLGVITSVFWDVVNCANPIPYLVNNMSPILLFVKLQLHSFNTASGNASAITFSIIENNDYRTVTLHANICMTDGVVSLNSIFPYRYIQFWQEGTKWFHDGGIYFITKDLTRPGLTPSTFSLEVYFELAYSHHGYDLTILKF